MHAHTEMEKINKTDKSSARLKKKNERRYKLPISGREKEAIATDIEDINRITR